MENRDQGAKFVWNEPLKSREKSLETILMSVEYIQFIKEWNRRKTLLKTLLLGYIKIEIIENAVKHLYSV